MRFKYYLRGAGIGVILTTPIFTIAFAVYKPTLSDDEIVQRQRHWAWKCRRMIATVQIKKIQRQQRIEKDDADASDSNTDDATTSEDGGQKNVIEFTIASGDTSATHRTAFAGGRTCR